MCARDGIEMKSELWRQRDDGHECERISVYVCECLWMNTNKDIESAAECLFIRATSSPIRSIHIDCSHWM